MDLTNLLPLIIGAAVLPVWIVIVLFLLAGEGGLRRASAFVAGAMLTRLVQGFLFGYVFGAAGDEYGEDGRNLIASTLLLVIGLLMLVSAVKQWRKEEDPDAPPPKWMAMLDGVSTLKAFGMGALLMGLAVKQWVFTLSALAVIEEAQLEQVGAALAFLGFTLAAQSLMLLPIIIYAVAPTQAARLLDAAQAWLARHNRVIVITVSLVFGTWFLWMGVTGLLG